MIDLYLAGVADGFVSALFSSFVGAVTGRSLLCCQARLHLLVATSSRTFEWCTPSFPAPPSSSASLPPRSRACQERMHFGAMYSQKYSHRDLPMKNEAVLQVLMQTSEFETRPEQWGGARPQQA